MHLPPHLPRTLKELKFPCTGCGACCRHIDLAEDIIVREDETHPYYFPYTHKEGVCENLGEDNKCKIYENRPLICRIDDLIEYFGMDKEKYYQENIKACHKLIDSLGLGEDMKPYLNGYKL